MSCDYDDLFVVKGARGDPGEIGPQGLPGIKASQSVHVFFVRESATKSTSGKVNNMPREFKQFNTTS